VSLVHNEQTKLTATWLNTLGSGSIITGVVAPFAAYLFGLPGLNQLPASHFAVSALVWLSAGLALHMLARLVLRRLIP
jgi:hypothetical protein